MINIQFIEGEISSSLMMEIMRKYLKNNSIGAHSSFVGQIRADMIDGKKVEAIEFTAHKEMAISAMRNIANKILEENNLLNVDILHSLGNIRVGKICMYISVAAGHRVECLKSIEQIVEKIKKETPIFGKEILVGGNHQWKKNKY